MFFTYRALVSLYFPTRQTFSPTDPSYSFLCREVSTFHSSVSSEREPTENSLVPGPELRLGKNTQEEGHELGGVP